MWYSRGKDIPFTVEDLKSRINICKNIFAEAVNLEEKGLLSQRFANDIKISNRTIAMIFSILLSVLTTSNCLTEDFEGWKNDYSANWIFENKNSELREILDLISKIKDKALC